MAIMETIGTDGVDIIYLDNAATTFPKPEHVYTAADTFYRQYGGNAGRGNNPLARVCARLLSETRDSLAQWLGVPSPESIVFAASATHALNLAILGSHLRPGAVIYVTPFEHNSVLRAVEHLHQTRGVEVRQIPFDRRHYTCQLDKLQVAFQSEPPAMVCATHASNVCGAMPPVMDIARLAKAANPDTIVIVDGAQTAGLFPVPFETNLIDALIFSGHKALYGPYGVAGVVLSSDWRPAPLVFGGTGTISESIQMPTDLPSAYEAGSHNIWAIAGLKAALEWLQVIGSAAIVEHTLQLSTQLHQALVRMPGVHVYPSIGSAQWSGIVSFTVDGIQPQAIETALGAAGIAVRAGLHCAPWAHGWMGTLQGAGTVRVSLGYANTHAHVEALLTHIEQMISVVD